MLFSTFHNGLSAHGGAACQSLREGSCPSAEPPIFTSIFFIFSLTKQPNTKSANIRTEVVFLQYCHNDRPASRISGVFLPSVHITFHRHETPQSPTPLYKIQSQPSLVAFRGIFCIKSISLHIYSENRANALSVFIHRILSFKFYVPLYAVFGGFLANFIHNYILFLIPSCSKQKPSVAAGYSGNGVPVISSSLSYSEICATQQGSIPCPCSCLVNPLCLISTKHKAVYSAKGAAEKALFANTLWNLRKLHGSSPLRGDVGGQMNVVDVPKAIALDVLQTVGKYYEQKIADIDKEIATLFNTSNDDTKQ